MRLGIRKWLRYGISLSLAVGVLAVLMGRQRWGDLSGGAGWRWLTGAGVLSLVYWFIRVARWRWMLAMEGRSIGWGRAWVSMLAGLGVGLVTPIRSGEIVRPLFVPQGPRVRLVGWIVIERMFDLSAVLTLGILGVFYMVFSGALLASGASAPPWVLLGAPMLLACTLGVPMLVHFRPKGLWRILARVLPGRAKQLAEARLTWRQFGIFYVVSLVAEALCLLSVFLCFSSQGRISLIIATALLPVVVLGNLLPAGPGGFGIREGTAALVLGAFGFSEPMVLASYLFQTLIVLVIPAVVGVVAAWIVETTKTTPQSVA
ncbi:MAG: lysylphosphatidylglycerol synthase transmembrane domain-containing protein [Planctomycetota bacterium]|nr:lysylphosphatidylglycerol synthase transmembrane domain-containing protein [Planctomycetota bacterium]